MDHNETISVLVVEPGKTPYEKQIRSGLESLQREVGGYIEAVYPYEEPVALLCDEEGKLNGKEWNRALRDNEGHIYDVVAGTFLIVGLGDENFGSLSDEHMEKFKDRFATPEMFVRINGRMAVIPVEEKESSKSSVLAKLNKPAVKEPQKEHGSKLHKEEAR